MAHPEESLTKKFAEALKRDFTKDWKAVGNHDYVTNSYHIHVTEPVDPFFKLSFESEFQKLSPGGAISYIEAANCDKNLDALMSVVQHIYDNILYAEINLKLDKCNACGYDGEIELIDEHGKLDWRCPNCGCMDHKLLTVARRTCGYIGSNFWNSGRTAEINDRYVHLDQHEVTFDVN